MRTRSIFDVGRLVTYQDNLAVWGPGSHDKRAEWICREMSHPPPRDESVNTKTSAPPEPSGTLDAAIAWSSASVHVVPVLNIALCALLPLPPLSSSLSPYFYTSPPCLPEDPFVHSPSLVAARSSSLVVRPTIPTAQDTTLVEAPATRLGSRLST